MTPDAFDTAADRNQDAVRTCDERLALRDAALADQALRLGECQDRCRRLELTLAERSAELAAMIRIAEEARHKAALASTAAGLLGEREAELAALRASTSWRITAPLRALARFFRAGR